MDTVLTAGVFKNGHGLNGWCVQEWTRFERWLLEPFIGSNYYCVKSSYYVKVITIVLIFM